MDETLNPYAPGAGDPPPALSGREEQVEAFQVLLKRLEAGRSGRSMILYGLRGVGKTVLLNEFERIARDGEICFVSKTEVRAETLFEPSIARQLHTILRAMSRKDRVRERALRALAVLRAFTVTHTPEGVEFKVDVEVARGVADSGMLEEDLVELFEQVGQVARDDGSVIVLLIDEMQFLDKTAVEALCAALHRVSQLRLPIALIGAGLPQLPGLIVEAKTYAERLFRYTPIGKLGEAAGRDTIALPAQELGIEYTDEALDLIVGRTETYAYFLQEYGWHSWAAAAESPIQAEDVQAAEPRIQKALDEGFFHARFEKATPTERAYMAAMADLGDGPYRSGQVSQHMGYRRQSEASVVRDRLIRKGLIFSPDHGQVDFSVPHFADFIRRVYPSLLNDFQQA